MARGDQLGRQWKIIQTLLSARRGRSAAELADELECHRRTVYRDLEALQIAGFPIYNTLFEGKTLWSLLDSVRHQMPIPLNLTELMALYFSRDMMKVLKNTVFFDSLESFFKKIKTMLPPEYIRYLEQIEKSIQVGQKSYKPYGKFRDIINVLNDAVLSRSYIEIEYYTMSRKKKTRRKVAPYKIWFFDGTFYLIGYCCERKDIRTFTIDRITELHQLSEHFDLPEDFNLDAFMRSSFGVFQGAPVAVKIWFSAAVSEYIEEKIWHETQRVVKQDDGSILFSAEVAGTDEIKFWILNWGAHARVLAPESLRDEIQAEIKAMLKLYLHEDRLVRKNSC